MRGASPFWHGLQQIFPHVSEFFKAKLGNGSIFKYWLDAWSTRGVLRYAFPRLFALSQNPKATVGDCWDNAWSPIFEGAVSDHRFREFLNMQQSLVQLRPLSGKRDAWEWEMLLFQFRRDIKGSEKGKGQMTRQLVWHDRLRGSKKFH